MYVSGKSCLDDPNKVNQPSIAGLQPLPLGFLGVLTIFTDHPSVSDWWLSHPSETYFSSSVGVKNPNGKVRCSKPKVRCTQGKIWVSLYIYITYIHMYIYKWYDTNFTYIGSLIFPIIFIWVTDGHCGLLILLVCEDSPCAWLHDHFESWSRSIPDHAVPHIDPWVP